MAGVKISALPPAASSQLTDLIPAVQSGTTDRETLQQVLTLYQASATDFTGLTGKLQAPTAIASSTGLNNIAFTYTASAVNYITSTNSATTFSPLLSATGSDPNINLILSGKGSGVILALSPTGTAPLQLVPSSGSNAFRGAFSIPTITASRTYTFQDASGTVAFTTQIDTWVDQTTTPVTMSVNTGYTADAGASLITLTLPATSSIGQWVEINGKGAGLYTIAQAAGQQIVFGNVSSTLGAGGSVSSQLVSDNIKLRCITANTIWTVVSSEGNFTIV